MIFWNRDILEPRDFGIAGFWHCGISATIINTAFLLQNTQSFFQIVHIHCFGCFFNYFLKNNTMIQYRKQMRHPGINYRSDGFYFITSCIHKRQRLFGEVNANGMQLNEWGKIAHQQWLWLEKQYPYAALVAFVIMPDHTHALINIFHDKNPESTIKKHSIVELMGAYKTTSSKLIHLAGCKLFKWQRSYYMRLIYKQEEIDNIIQYINNNPAKWYASKKNRT